MSCWRREHHIIFTINCYCFCHVDAGNITSYLPLIATFLSCWRRKHHISFYFNFTWLALCDSSFVRPEHESANRRSNDKWELFYMTCVMWFFLRQTRAWKCEQAKQWQMRAFLYDLRNAILPSSDTSLKARTGEAMTKTRLF